MLNAVRIWILLSTLFVAAGWILSVFRQLNSFGYTAICAMAVIAFFSWRQKTKWRPAKNSAQTFYKFRRRFKRAPPLLFLALAGLTLIGGWWYAPSNGSSIAYRIPRVMHWLDAGQWHWVRTLDARINIAGCGMEWLFAPLILLTRTDQFLFLPNWFAFLLMPGLIFSVFTRLGVRPRVAWWWMWLLSSGWCFIMQTNSTINDAFATVYALAALDLAFRAREKKNAADLCLALLAAALATGVKQTGVLLALPAMIVLLPDVRWALKRPFALLAIVAVCALVSALPMMIFDAHYAGSWSGVSSESWDKAQLHSPFWGVIGNVFCLTVQNFKPPVFPFVHAWNDARNHFLQTSFGSHFAGFEDFARLGFGVSETNAGIGMGVCVLIVISWLAAKFYCRSQKIPDGAKHHDLLLRLLRWLPWLMLLAFMAKVGTFENGRQLAAYYVLLFPALLISTGHSVLIRQRWWQISALLVMLLSVSLLVISRDRPLFPAQVVIDRLTAKSPQSKFVANISATFGRTPEYEQQKKFLRENLPANEKVLGYAVDGGELETLLWLPFGQRRVQLILPGDAPEKLSAAGIHSVVLERFFLSRHDDTLEHWLATYGGTVTKEWDFLDNPYDPPQHFYLVSLKN